MPIVVSGGDFKPAPAGIHSAVCVDVRDVGMVETPWGKKHKIAIVWEIDALMEDGKRFIVTKWYTAALNDKSNLFKDLQSWRGRPFTMDELKGFDVEKVVGAPCVLVIVQANKKTGGIAANVQAVAKADPQKKLTPSGKYIRWKDRPENQRGALGAGGSDPGYAAPDEDPIPF